MELLWAWGGAVSHGRPCGLREWGQHDGRPLALTTSPVVTTGAAQVVPQGTPGSPPQAQLSLWALAPSLLSRAQRVPQGRGSRVGHSGWGIEQGLHPLT